MKSRTNVSSPWLFVITTSAVLAGCATSSFKTVDKLPGGPRHADGVAVDPAPSPVVTKLRGSTTTIGAIALTPSPALEEARDVVKRYFDAMVEEDDKELTLTVSISALWSHPQSGGRGGSNALNFCRERTRRLDYQALSGRQVVRSNEIEIYRTEDLENPPPGRPSKPYEMVEGDVLARARVLVPRYAGDRMFGDEILFLLRVEKGAYRIRWMQEDFQLP